MVQQSSAGLDDLVRQARAALAGQTAVDADEVARRRYTGTAADGQVQADVDAQGRVRVLRIEPEVFQQPLADIAAAAQTAINAALDRRPGRADLTPIVDELRTAGELARRELSAITQGLAQITSEVRTARGTAGRDAATSTQ